jgi:ABC-type phosphate/phosphonate transport system ATPase subunit
VVVAQPGQVAVVGEVGAGKSMLLLSLLKETGAQFDFYHIGDKDAQKLSADEVRRAVCSCVLYLNTSE